MRYSVITASVPKRLQTEEQAGIYMGYSAMFEKIKKLVGSTKTSVSRS
jgi:hypothetical protein